MRRGSVGIPSPGFRGRSINDDDDEDGESSSSSSAGELRALVSMITISASTLTCLRTECATTAGLIQQEIRTLEGKLVKLFSRAMLLIKQPGSDADEHDEAALVLWLSVVGLSDVVCQALVARLRTLEGLMSRSDSDVRLCLKDLGASAEDTRRLVSANKNLRRYTDILMRGGSDKEDEVPLHWDSWDRSSPSLASSSSSSSSLVSNATDRTNNRHYRGQHSHQVPRRPAVVDSRTSPTPTIRSNSGYYHQRHEDGHSSSSSSMVINAPGGCSDHGHSPQSPPVFSPPSFSSSSSSSRVPVPSVSVSLSPSPSPTYGGPGGGGLWRPLSTVSGPSPPASPPVHRNRYVEAGNGSRTPPTTTTTTTTEAKKSPSRGNVTGKGETQHHPPPPQCIVVTNSSSDSTDLNGMFPLTKSKSHESQLGTNKGDGSSPKSGQKGGGGGGADSRSSGADANGRHRLPTDGGLDAIDSYNHHPLKSPPECDSDSSGGGGGGGGLQVPRSPITPTFPQGSMSHVIEHRFTKSFSFRVATCDYCQKQMIMGMRCKECKYKCHNDCSVKVPPSCGLPHDIFQEVMKKVTGSPILGRAGMSPVHGSSNHLLSSPGQGQMGGGNSSSRLRRKKNSGGGGFHVGNAFHQGPDSSSTASSCNSSTPSSPNVVLTVSTPPSASRHKQFFFPDSTVLGRKQIVQDATAGRTHEEPASSSRSRVVPTSALVDHSASSCSSSSSSSLPTSGGGGGGVFSSHSGRVTGIVATTAASSSSSSCSRVTATSSKSTLPEGVESQKSNDSDKTLSVSGNGSGGSVSGSTTDSERTIAVRLDSQDSVEQGGLEDDKPWPRQNSLSLREWDIPFDELQMIDRIGIGRFGSVYKGQWHGYVAIKVLNMDSVDDRDKTLEAFKNEVGTFRKTRHENLVLFMGACMKPPHLAIVTSLCKGSTLFAHVHIMKDRFSMSKVVIIAQQVSQGMGYLHARGIVHKDLKTRNIFLEGGKVVITDFGLFSVAKLCCPAKNRHQKSIKRDRTTTTATARCSSLAVPRNWLCYLSPEIVRSLRAGSLSAAEDEDKNKDKEKNDPFDLPFSAASDVYSFGTVWYELLCGEFPFRGQPAESVVWQVGKGIKDPLVNVQASREVKEVLMNCWAYNPEERPEFGALLEILKEWPKKKPKRSPSYPTHLSRSHESVF